MQLKELRETLTDARLLIPAEMASMDYKLRDRRRFDHLISIARWAQQENAMVTLDADINPGLLYATLLLELDFDQQLFRTSSISSKPSTGAPILNLCQSTAATPSNISKSYSCSSPMRWPTDLGEVAAKGLLIEPFLIAPPPPNSRRILTAG